MPFAVHHRWLLAQAALWLPLLAATAWVGKGDPAAARWLIGTGGVAALVSAAVLWRLLGVAGRAADRVTGARLVLLTAAVLAAAVAARITWAVWLGLLVAVLLDLVDGWCARRFGGSEAGAVLDMECDQLAVTLLAMAGAGLAGAGIWLLLLPAMKHLHVLVLTARAVPAHDPKPRDGDNRIGRWICAGVMTALLVVTAPATPRLAVTIVGLAAVAALAWSFGRDLVYLLRRGPGRASATG